MPIRIDVLDAASPVQRRLLATLLEDLLPLARIPDVRRLARVVAVPGDAIEATINKLVGGGGYAAGPHPAEAVAVPLERDDELECHVVLAGELVRLLDPEGRRPYPLVGSLLEELLHVRVYAAAWRQRGRLEPAGLTPEARDVFVLCSRFHDEYVVDRDKATSSSSRPIYDHPYLLGERTPLVL